MQHYLEFSEEVRAARLRGQAVVALESTIISHGMPYPQNVQTARLVEQIIRDNGAVPATIAVMNGKICIGLSDEQLELLGKTGLQAIKASRRDLPYLITSGKVGATTVAATMICAKLAGIDVFVTGGVGGVHRGAETSFDISADLQELARTSVAVVCAGAKSILDLGWIVAQFKWNRHVFARCRDRLAGDNFCCHILFGDILQLYFDHAVWRQGNAL